MNGGFFYILSTVINKYETKKGFNDILDFVIQEKKKQIHVHFRDAVQFLTIFLPQNKKIIKLDDLQSIEDMKGINWEELELRDQDDKKYVLMCLLFI